MPLPKLLPKPTGGQPPEAPEPQPNGQRKRKRGLHHTACERCRIKKEKCGGERPKCEGCKRKGVECVYEAPPGVTRQQSYKEKVQEFVQSTSSLRDVVELLRSGSEADAAVALSRIRQAENINDAIESLATARALLIPTASTSRTVDGQTLEPNGVPNTHQSHRHNHRFLASPCVFKNNEYIYKQLTQYRTDSAQHMFERTYTQVRDQYNETDVFIDLPALGLPISKWASACQDNRLMNHILTLFWTWDVLVQATFYRPMLEEDLVNEASVSIGDSHTFCSPFLVNALLALGCLFTLERETFADPDDPSTRGRRFAEEAEKHFEKENNRPSIPLLQGQFAMFVYEGNLGSGTKSVEYFMQAMKTHGALNNDDFLNTQSQGKSEARWKREREGLSWVMWGFYCSEWRASQAFGIRKPTAKPLISQLWLNDMYPLRQTNSADYWWFPYPISLKTQRSMRVEIREVDCRLSSLAEDVLDYLYPLSGGPSEPPVTDHLRCIELYNALVQWKFSLTGRLRLEEAVQPHAILLHSHVECLLVALLRPFWRFAKADFGPFDPKARCYAHCASLMDTIWTFRAFVSLNYEYWYNHTIATIAFVCFQEHADSPVQTETLIKACKCLHEMTAVFPLAADSLSAIRGAFKLAGMPVPTYLQPFLESGVKHRKDGLLHHSAAKLLPGGDGWASDAAQQEMKYQELLDKLDSVGMD